MAGPTTTQQKRPPPLWKQLSNFTNGHPLGIEKTLRLIQAICTVLSSSIFVSYIPNSTYAIKCASAKSQVALGRRYLRFFKFIQAFAAGHAAWQTPAPLESDAVKKIAAVGKWSFLGVYFFLDNLTILDAMGIWETPWAQDVFLEAHKWWFYSLLLGITGSTIAIFFPATENTSSSSSKQSAKKNDNHSEKKEQQQPSASKQDLTPFVKTIIIDSCDLLIPGGLLGWIPASPTQVGIAMIVSTLTSSSDIWAKVNI